jgi:hypothetical protein
MSSSAAYSRRWRERHPERHHERQRKQLARPERPSAMRKAHLRRAYGLSLEDYEQLVASHEGRCAICKHSEVGNLPVDHDHKTGRIRGLLCQRCNRAIGMFKDSPELCDAAAHYLRKHRKANE